MALTGGGEFRDVKGISDPQRREINAFLQGAVQCWVKNRPGDDFRVRDLVGGENGDWGGTPLHVLYDKHIDMGKDHMQAYRLAAIDAGWLMKLVLRDDSQRMFELVDSGWPNSYRYVSSGAAFAPAEPGTLPPNTAV